MKEYKLSYVIYRSCKTSSIYYISFVTIIAVCTAIPIFLEHEIQSYEIEKFENKNGSRHFKTDTTIYLIVHTDLKKENFTYLIIYDIVCKIIMKCVIPYILLLATNLLMVRTFCNLKQKTKKEEKESFQNETLSRRRKPNVRNIYSVDKTLKIG